MVEKADARGSNPLDRKIVQVRPLSLALEDGGIYLDALAIKRVKLITSCRWESCSSNARVAKQVDALR